jgi:hypothetical protein
MPNVIISCPSGSVKEVDLTIAWSIVNACKSIPELSLTERNFTINIAEGEKRIFGNDIIVTFAGLFQTPERTNDVLKRMTEAVVESLKSSFRSPCSIKCIVLHSDSEIYTSQLI